MKNKKIVALLLVFCGVILSGSVAYAATPTLSVSSVNSGSALVTVFGDSNSAINLYYNSGSPSGVQSRNIGTTDSSGHFSQYINVSSYGILTGYQVYVMVNGQQSNYISWPYGGVSGQLSLSQTNLNISIGQIVNVFVYGSYNVIGYNSNSNLIGLSVTGNQITVTGSNSGTATVTLCDQSNQSSCVILYVTVQGGNNQGNITFGQNNVTVYNGQTTNVSIFGGVGNYNVSSNSNYSAVSASINGSMLVLVGGSSAGNATITVCDQNSRCGSVYVTSSGGYGLGLITPANFQITNNVLNKTLSQYSYANSVEAQAGDIVEFEIKIQTNNYQMYQNNNTLLVNLNDVLPYGLTYITGSTKVNGYTVVDGITSIGIYLNNFYQGQEQVVKFSAMVNSNLYSETLTNQLTATMSGNTQTASSYVVVRSRGTVLGAADIVTGEEGTMPLAVFFGLIVSMPLYYFFFYRKFVNGKKVIA